MSLVDEFKINIRNLEKRTDRLEKFKTLYEKYIPQNLEYHVVKAVDGYSEEFRNTFKENPLYSPENNYTDSPNIFACAMSHVSVLREIASSNKYGLVLEDDINFREDGFFIRNHKKILRDILSAVNTYETKYSEPVVVYIGAGDVLPIHTNCVNSASLLRAQERSHIKEFINDTVGVPKEKNAYIFDWIGAFSYVISPESARRVLKIIEETRIKKAIDVLLKESSMHLMTYPLLAYHNTLETCDSDTVKRDRRE